MAKNYPDAFIDIIDKSVNEVIDSYGLKPLTLQLSDSVENLEQESQLGMMVFMSF